MALLPTDLYSTPIEISAAETVVRCATTTNASAADQNSFPYTKKFIFITPCLKCGFTHALRAEIRIFAPRNIKCQNVFLTSVITSLAFSSCCKLTLVRKRFIALKSYCTISQCDKAAC